MKNKEFLKSLSALADQLRRTIEAEVVGFDPSPAAIAGRRAQVMDAGRIRVTFSARL